LNAWKNAAMVGGSSIFMVGVLIALVG